MEITPLSFVPKEVSSPHKVMNHHDSLIFSITSEKFNSRKETLLLDESKEMNKSKNDSQYNDYFTIQDKIKLLEEKVENIKTNYYESDIKENDMENQPRIANLEFPEEIYIQKCFPKDEKSEIGKIKRKKEKSYFTVSEKPNTKSRSNSKNNESIMTTKRNDMSVYNVNDFSVYRPRNSFSRHKETPYSNKVERERNSSFKMEKMSTKYDTNQVSELRKLRKELSQNKISVEKLSKKSKESQRKLSMSKEETRKLKSENSGLQKSLSQLQEKLKRSEKIREKQKEMIQQQKEEIEQLKGFLEEVLKRNNDSTLRESIKRDKETKLKILR